MRRASCLLWLCLAFPACSTPKSAGSDPTPSDDASTDDSASSDDSTAPRDSSVVSDSARPSGDSTVPTDTGKPPVDTSVTPDTPGGPCTNDMECAANEYCVYPGGTCKALPTGKCTGSTAGACGGYLPRCKDYSCFTAGDCGGKDSNCHAGEACVAKGGATLCKPTSPCKETVSALDVANGVYAAGKEVCIRDVVHEVLSETDGDYHVRMGKLKTAVFGTCPFPVVPPGTGLVTELTPEYGSSGLSTPTVGATVTVQGTVRWDGAHCWWEIHPVKYFGP